MAHNSLDAFTAAIRSAWAPISSELVTMCRLRLEELVRADPAEDWLASLLAERPASRELDALCLADETEAWLARLLAERPATRELHREPDNGFMLLAHNENEGLFRPPHDHGRAWVVYGVQSGELELRTYARVQAGGAEDRLVLRDTSLLRAGEAKAYLPGDIHDTRCLTESALLFRFTERDLRYEDQVEHKLSRFVERDGYWTAPRP